MRIYREDETNPALQTPESKKYQKLVNFIRKLKKDTFVTSLCPRYAQKKNVCDMETMCAWLRIHAQEARSRVREQLGKLRSLHRRPDPVSAPRSSATVRIARPYSMQKARAWFIRPVRLRINRSRILCRASRVR